MPALQDNTLNFVYDDYGNRVKKSLNNSDITYYLNDGLTVLNELDSAGNVNKTMVKGLDPVAEILSDGSIQYVHTDALGSTVLLTNEAGNIVRQYEYDSFGQITSPLSSAEGRAGWGLSDTKYTYTNQEYDPESDLYYYNARYYNPRLGRFISRDTVLGQDGDTLSRNLYIYVKNNPLKYVDPTGNEEEKKQDDDWLTKLLTNPKFQKGVKKAEAISKFALDIPTFGGASRAEEISQKIEREGLTTKNLALVYSNTLISSAAGALSALDAGVGLGAVVNRIVQTFSRNTERFYRVMKENDYQKYLQTGKVPATAETFTSPSLEYLKTKNYNGILVEFKLKSGTTNALESIGVRDFSAAASSKYGTMPHQFEVNDWTMNNAFFKGEGAQNPQFKDLVNIGLGQGRALDIFNEHIINSKIIDR